MKRTTPISYKKADAILSADFHLRDSIPICRGDEFESAQWKKVDFISALQKTHDCPVLHSGDLFNHWKPSPYLLSKTMEHLPDEFYTIYGNHDLPQHNFEERDKSGIYVLEQAGKLKVLQGTHWGEKPKGASWQFYIHRDASGDAEVREVLIWHVMTYQTKLPWPGCTDPKAAGILRKYKDYDVILTGHNHKAFVETYEKRLLVNPGSITRQDADQIEFAPRVYLYYAETNTVEAAFLPIESDAVSRAHIERSSERDDRIDAFITKIGGEYDAGLNFETNLEKFFQSNNIRTSVKEKIYKAIES